MRTTLRRLFDRLRARHGTEVERELAATADARRRGTTPTDPSTGTIHPQHDPSGGGRI